MTTLLFGLWKLVGWRGLLVGAVIAFGAYWHSSSISEAYDDGAQSVRLEMDRMVSRAEHDALAAVLAQERAKSAAAAALATEARNRADALLRAKQTQQDEIDRLTNLANETKGLSYPTKEDLEWSAKPR